MLSCLFIAALYSPAWKGLNTWLSFVMFNRFFFVTFPCDWLIVSIADLCHLSYLSIFRKLVKG